MFGGFLLRAPSMGGASAAPLAQASGQRETETAVSNCAIATK